MDVKMRDNLADKSVVSLRPLREEQVELPSVDGNSVTLKVFAKTEEGRERKVMIPPRDARWVSTQVLMTIKGSIFPNWTTPPKLSDMKLQVLDMRDDPETREVQIQVYCMHPTDARYLDHGDPLVLLHFLPTVSPVVETW